MDFVHIYNEAVGKSKPNYTHDNDKDLSILNQFVKLVNEKIKSGVSLDNIDIPSIANDISMDIFKSNDKNYSPTDVAKLITATDLYERSALIATACGNELLDQKVTLKILQRFTNYLRLSVSDMNNDISLYKKAYDTSKTTVETNDKILFTEFREFYLSERQKEISAHPDDKDKVVLSLDDFNNLKSVYDNVKKEDANTKNSILQANYFGSIRPELGWIDRTFNNNDFLYSGALKDRFKWFEYVYTVESEINNNLTTEQSQSDVDTIWKEIIDGFVNLQKEYEELMKDRRLEKLKRENVLVSDVSRTLAGSLSALSLSLGGFAYLFGAFIPGGDQYANYMASVAKLGRRVGKLFANHNSKVEQRRNAEVVKSSKDKFNINDFKDDDSDNKKLKDDVKDQKNKKPRNHVDKESDDSVDADDAKTVSEDSSL